MTADTRPAGRQVTPVILTFNEAANIARVLEHLRWAERVVVVDSGSTDETERIAREAANVHWVVRPFDTHADQWRFAVHETGITTDYVLALDADYTVPAALVDEIESRFLPGAFHGGIARFTYCVEGRPLWRSVYPAKIVIFRRDTVQIAQPGHTQEVSTSGPVYQFERRLVHDDRKSLARFVQSQAQYVRLESRRLSSQRPRRWQDRVRLAGLMPVVAGVAGYVLAGGPFYGRAALRYAYERTLFECMLAIDLLTTRLRGAGEAPHRPEFPRG